MLVFFLTPAMVDPALPPPPLCTLFLFLRQPWLPPLPDLVAMANSLAPAYWSSRRFRSMAILRMTPPPAWSDPERRSPLLELQRGPMRLDPVRRLSPLERL